MPSTSSRTGTAVGDTGDQSVPFGEAALAGAGAYVVGYLLAYVWKAQSYREAFAQVQPLVELFGGETPSAWKIIGWLHYSAHFVDARIEVAMFRTYVDLIAEGGGNLVALYLVPPLLLAGAGFLVARRFAAAGNVVDGATAGAAVTLGYLALVIVGVFAFRVNGSGPGLVPTVLQAGIAYPLVFGSLGGAAAGYVGEKKS